MNNKNKIENVTERLNEILKERDISFREFYEEFIFETIHPYCENILQIKINKEELKQILLNGMQKTQSKWIPVSERLPEKYKEVIVTDIETSDTYQSYYIGDGYWECDNGAFKNRIIAWMPKPEPYEENTRPATKEEQLDNIRKKTEPFTVAQELKKRLEDKNE